ncbi:MAG: proline--tRNA ligase [Mariprofundales bacterium]
MATMPPMKSSQLFAPTMRETPAHAEVISHQLLLRAGFVRGVTSGVYDFLPLGLKVIRRIEAIVREEMNAAGAQELLMPAVQPAELWQQSGRWEKYGKELLRFTDRHNHACCFGPTHEEVICSLVRQELRSYRQLPLNMYQIQSKFRDEVRPRFGILRGREFIMKDAYSFHVDADDLLREYENMFATYERICTRLELDFRAVQADTGSIGGHRSHEFHVLADAGEDILALCNSCGYAANVEMATAKHANIINGTATDNMQLVATPNKTSVEEVSSLLAISASILVKTMMYNVEGGEYDGQTVAISVRGDDNVQEIKLIRLLKADKVCFANDVDIKQAGAVAGYIGPQHLQCPVWLDDNLKGAYGLIAGANQVDNHITGVNIDRDVGQAQFADVRAVRAGDICQCGSKIILSKGIEVGHVFALGDCYSEPMQVSFLNKNGRKQTPVMGCYGIGISRLLAAIVEQKHDDAGIIWPKHLAPFAAVIIPIGRGTAAQEKAEFIYKTLQAKDIDVLLDERKERPGVKFRDAELMGIPIQLIVGERNLEKGLIEVQTRGGDKELLDIDTAIAALHN